MEEGHMGETTDTWQPGSSRSALKTISSLEDDFNWRAKVGIEWTVDLRAGLGSWGLVRKRNDTTTNSRLLELG